MCRRLEANSKYIQNRVSEDHSQRFDNMTGQVTHTGIQRSGTSPDVTTESNTANMEGHPIISLNSMESKMSAPVAAGLIDADGYMTAEGKAALGAEAIQNKPAEDQKVDKQSTTEAHDEFVESKYKELGVNGMSEMTNLFVAGEANIKGQHPPQAAFRSHSNKLIVSA